MTASTASALFDPATSAEARRPARQVRASDHHYDAICDYLLANPGCTTQDIARHIRRGHVWVSMVMRSDTFQAHYRERRVVVDAAVRDAVVDKAARAAGKAADLVYDDLVKNPLGISTMAKVEITERMAGLMHPPASSAGVVVNQPSGAVLIASPDMIARARERLSMRQSAVVAGTPPPAKGSGGTTADGSASLVPVFESSDPAGPLDHRSASSDGTSVLTEARRSAVDIDWEDAGPLHVGSAL